MKYLLIIIGLFFTIPLFVLSMSRDLGLIPHGMGSIDWLTWLMFILIALFVGTSMVFIPLMGITGAALAAMVSNIIYNMLGVVVVGRRFGLWPYGMVHLKMTIVGLAAASAGFLIPQVTLIPDIIIRSLLVTFIFIGGVYFWRLSDDMNGLFASFMAKLKNRL